jgi:hypothetical protein
VVLVFVLSWRRRTNLGWGDPTCLPAAVQ